MPDEDMKDATKAVKEDAPGASEDFKSKPSGPAPTTLEDIARNVLLIVKAVETNQSRLTTRAISRWVDIGSYRRHHIGDITLWRFCREGVAHRLAFAVYSVDILQNVLVRDSRVGRA